MSKVRRMLAVMLLGTLLLSLCLPGTGALAAGATSVIVNGVTLTSGQYLANGSAVASATPPASGGYAYFGNSTLTLLDAVINTLTIIPGHDPIMSLISADGDLNVVLAGSSTLNYSGSYAGGVQGIFAEGEMTIGGTGSILIILNNAASGANAFGIYGTGALTVLSGSVTVTVSAARAAFALISSNNMLISGGTLQLETRGAESVGLFSANGNNRITGGDITSTNESTSSYGIGLYTGSVSLEGGTGYFQGYGGDVSFGLVFNGPSLQYSGGDFTFIGNGSGLDYDEWTIPNYTFSYDGGAVFVSMYTDGSLPSRWYSDADGRLISEVPYYSDFKYVRFTIVADAVMPQTGDNAHPWLWAGIGLLCLLGAAGWVAAARQKCR